MTDRNVLFVVKSTYGDGDGFIEGAFSTREAAERKVASVKEFRQDQDEAPLVTVEEWEK